MIKILLLNIICILQIFLCSAASGQDLINGNFEQGQNAGWQPYNNYDRNVLIMGNRLFQPYSGRWFVSLVAREYGEVSRLSQQITLPNIRAVYLNLFIFLYSEEMCDVPYYDAIVISINQIPLIENPRICSGNPPVRGWIPSTFDLSMFAGQTVLITFQVSTIDTGSTVFSLDNISIDSKPLSWPPDNWRR